jgi:hypothetical protein
MFRRLIVHVRNISGWWQGLLISSAAVLPADFARERFFGEAAVLDRAFLPAPFALPRAEGMV